MPKRILDGDAMWSSSKLARCIEWAIPEYAWLYSLADANGSFEITNLRVIHGKIAAIRPNMGIETLQKVFAEFQRNGLLFVWSISGKSYGHWTGSDQPGRLPPPSTRSRFEAYAPPVPKHALKKYTDACEKLFTESSRQHQEPLLIDSCPDLDLEKDLDLVKEKKEPDAAAAFFALGFEQPFGDEKFQEVWAVEYSEMSPGSNFTDSMERTAQKCKTLGVTVPNVFFSTKRHVEEAEVKNRFHRTPQ